MDSQSKKYLKIAPMLYVAVKPLSIIGNTQVKEIPKPDKIPVEKSSSSMVLRRGLRNCGNRCYLNITVQDNASHSVSSRDFEKLRADL